MPNCRPIASRTSGGERPTRLRIVAERRHGSSGAVSYFRRSVENQQIFESSSEVSRSLQPPRHLSSGIRLTEQTACCPPAPSRFGQIDGRVRQIKSEPGGAHNIHASRPPLRKLM